MRWIFILMLLGNVLYFGWQMRQPASETVQAPLVGVAHIRMLDEVDRSLLLPRTLVSVPQESSDEVLLPPSVVPENKTTGLSSESDVNLTVKKCQVLSGLGDSVVAHDLQSRLALQGVASSVLPVEVERVLSYELVLEQPESEVDRRGMVENLEALSMVVEEARLGNAAVYIIGRYDSQAALNQARDALIGAFEPVLYQVISKEKQFELWLSSDASEETVNKINELQGFFSSTIKIEKKLCKGVASVEARD